MHDSEKTSRETGEKKGFVEGHDDDSDADAFAILGLLLVLAVSIVYHLSA